MRGVASTTAKSTNRPPRWVDPISRHETLRNKSAGCCAVSDSVAKAATDTRTTRPAPRRRDRRTPDRVMGTTPSVALARRDFRNAELVERECEHVGDAFGIPHLDVAALDHVEQLAVAEE